MISLIVACTNEGVIGNSKNELPWVLKKDLQHFKEKTLNKTIVMGRRTFESLGNVPLGNRKNIVITRAVKPQKIKGVTYFKSPEPLLNLVDKEMWVIGGGDIYRSFLPFADKVYLTEVDFFVEKPGATFPVHELANWSIDYISQWYMEEGIKFRFKEYIKK